MSVLLEKLHSQSPSSVESIENDSQLIIASKRNLIKAAFILVNLRRFQRVNKSIKINFIFSISLDFTSDLLRVLIE